MNSKVDENTDVLSLHICKRGIDNTKSGESSFMSSSASLYSADHGGIPSNMCMWCETVLPNALFSKHKHEATKISGLKTLQVSSDVNNVPCPLCFCNVDDKQSPQLLRDKYLGGNTCTKTLKEPFCPHGEHYAS